jgi:hypothetical protein
MPGGGQQITPPLEGKIVAAGFDVAAESRGVTPTLIRHRVTVRPLRRTRTRAMSADPPPGKP